MKVFVTGIHGQLGYDVLRELRKRGHHAVGSSRNAVQPDISLDITDVDKVHRTILSVCPDAVIHCAAWTAVDAAEDPGNLDSVRAVNVEATSAMAKACKEIGCKMVYISTDYVFDGQGDTPWAADCKAYSPLSVYGKTKLEGELAVCSTLDKYFIVRTAWVFGLHGKNFVKTMLRLAETHKQLRVVNDQIGTPTFTPDLARLLVDMVETEEYGYYHATNEGGYISWADFAKEIFSQAGLDVVVVPVSTEEYGLNKAKRPANSRLDNSKLTEKGFAPLPLWQDALKRYMEMDKSCLNQ